MRDIVEARITTLFAQLAERIERSGVGGYAGQLMVLTGGASRLPGLGDAAAQYFGRPVRVASMAALPGLPKAMCSPAFATAVGLAHVALDPAAGVRRGGDGLQESSYLQRMGEWLRESF